MFVANWRRMLKNLKFKYFSAAFAMSVPIVIVALHLSLPVLSWWHGLDMYLQIPHVCKLTTVKELRGQSWQALDRGMLYGEIAGSNGRSIDRLRQHLILISHPSGVAGFKRLCSNMGDRMRAEMLCTNGTVWKAESVDFPCH